MKERTQMLKRALVFLLAELFAWQVCLAQVDPWERVKLIEQGKKVQVKLHSGKNVNGKMEAWSTEGLSIRQGKDRAVPVAKSDVAQVAMVSGLSRGRKAGYAFLITGGTIAGLTYAACSSSGCEEPYAAFAALGLAGFFGAIAAGIAALFPQHKEVIYTVAASAPADPARR
jgi:hypothetical protein